MRRPMVQNPFSFLLVFYLLVFAVFFFYSIFAFPNYLATFQWPFVWTNSFLLFMRYCIPVTASAVAVAYSLLPTAETVRVRRGRQPFSRLVSSHLTTFIALTVLYTALVLGLYPIARKNMERFDSLTLQARVFLEKADAALEEEDRETALLNYQRYLAIDQNNRKIMALVSDIQMELIAEHPEPRQEVERGIESLRVKDLAEGKEAYELLEMAEDYFDREDYFSAHYYADLAFQLDPTRQDARRLVARAREMIVSKDLSKLETEEQQLFERKREGYEYFVNEEYFKAYHMFRELQVSYPQDADVSSYLRKSEERLSRETFFLDEAEEIDTLPGVTELLFVNQRKEDEREIVFIGKLAAVEAGLFCKDIEVLRFGSRGLLYHYYAEYGRLRNSSINLHGIDRTAAERESVPRYLSGAARLRRDRLPYMLSIIPTLEQLPTLKAGKAASATAESLGFFSLWQVRRQIGSFGYMESFISGEILRRLLLPFSFLVLALLSVAVGWRFQARFIGRPHWILLVFMPLFPLVAIPITTLYLHAQRIILAFVLLRWHFSGSLVVFLVLQGLLLLITMIVLAGQRSD
ncbi:MAG: hypothetical protein JSV89_09930 [Spirochaetaceae bacterium]|nr:MAG: hypothetical protein JSV89_09930 [Spirochaetaceae bacterium]